MIHVNASVISKVNAEANVNNKVVRGIANETVDYITQVKNKPSINGIALKGNRTSADLGLQPAGDYATMSDIPTKVSELQNDSGFLTSTDLPSPSFILAIPFDENGVMLGTPTAYYQFTKREYIDTSSAMTVTHWFSAEEMVAMGNMLLYCYPVMIGFGVVVTNLLHHYCYRDLDGYYQTYTTTQLESQQEVWQELTGENGNYIHVQLVDNSTILPIAKGYDRKVRLSTFDNDANYVQDAHYVHIDGVSNNAKQANGILLGKVDADSTATVMKATVPSLNELYDGACVYLMNGVVTSASGWTLNVNGLGAKPVYQTLAQESRSTTIFNVNYTMMFVYNSQRVEGGCWDIYYGYNSDTNTTAYQVRSNGSGYLAQAKFYRYRLLFEAIDGVHVVPANTSTSTNATTNRTPNTAPFNPFGRIFYYSTTTAIDAEALCSASYLWERYAGISLGYSFAKGSALTMTNPKAVYLKCTPQTDNSVVLDATDPYVQDLPSTEDGSVYIYLGQATSATAIELAENHPVYQYKSGKICLFTGN